MEELGCLIMPREEGKFCYSNEFQLKKDAT